MSVAERAESETAGFGVPVLRRTFANLLAWIRSAFGAGRIRTNQRRPAWARPGWLILGAAAAIALIANTMVFLDPWVMTHQRAIPLWAIQIFAEITDLGRSSWVLVPTALITVALAAVSSPAIGRIGQGIVASIVARLGFVFLAVAVPGLLVAVVKRIVGRARPYTWETGGQFDFDPFNWTVEFASLPSGHGTTAFATAFAVGALYPRLRLPLWSLAAVIGLSRVVVSAHYPSDVLAGAIIGILGALVVRNWFAVRRLTFVVTPERSVRPLPGPSLRYLRRLSRLIARR